MPFLRRDHLVYAWSGNMIIRNAAAQLTALAAVIVTQTAYSVAVARLLGVEDFGQFSFVFSITQILLTGCDLGLHNTAVRKIAVFCRRGPLLRRRGDLRQIFFIEDSGLARACRNNSSVGGGSLQ